MTKSYFLLFVCSKSESTVFQLCLENVLLSKLNQYLAADKAPCSSIEHSDSTGGES